MYQLVGLIMNKFMFGPSNQHGDQTLASWQNRRYLADESLSHYEKESTSEADKMSQEVDESDYTPTNLKIVIIFSGKRKSGKDHISTLITDYIGYQRMRHLAILRIAGPIKEEFARNNKLDFARLLDSSPYKERFRIAMVDWSEEYREKQGWNCFLRKAIKEQRAKDKAIWILNDARRLCDIEYFDQDPAFVKTKIIKLRIEADLEARESRGWKYIPGIDDRDTECGLDEYENWSYVIENNSNDGNDSLKESLKPIFEEIDRAIQEVDHFESRNAEPR